MNQSDNFDIPVNMFRADNLAMRLQAYGADGLLTLLLSNIVIMATAGLTLVLSLLYVTRIARSAPVTARTGSVLVVLGMRLDNNNVNIDYQYRLDRVIALCNEDSSHPVLVVGGNTSSTGVTEASMGVAYLVAEGINPERISVEVMSRHTLENLRNIRSFMNSNGVDDFTIISNRYHLARVLVISRGLGMKPCLSAAENDFVLEMAKLPRLLLEAYYINWYHTGAIWSRLVSNRKSLWRIS